MTMYSATSSSWGFSSPAETSPSCVPATVAGESVSPIMVTIDSVSMPTESVSPATEVSLPLGCLATTGYKYDKMNADKLYSLSSTPE